MLLFPWCRIISNLQFSLPSISLPATTQNSRVAGLVVILFRFSKISPKCLTSNPLPQIATFNPRLQPNTHFAVDMFPYKKTELFQKSGFRSKPPKKPGNTPLSGTYLSFLDIKTTVSTCHECAIKMHIPWLFVKPWIQKMTQWSLSRPVKTAYCTQIHLPQKRLELIS